MNGIKIPKLIKLLIKIKLIKRKAAILKKLFTHHIEPKPNKNDN